MTPASTNLLLRRVRQAMDPKAWRAVATDLGWRRAGRCRPPVTRAPTGLVVRWPLAYRLPDAEGFVGTLLRGFTELATVEEAEIAQPWDGIVVFELLGGGGAVHRIAIDYADATDLNTSCADSVSLTFKFQYLRDGYGRSNVVPGGFVSRAFLHDYYCRLRELRDDDEADVYGRFGLRFSAELRSEAVQLLSSQDRFTYDGGTFTYGGGGGGMLIYSEHLRRAARAKVCIDLPGNGPFCYRLVDYLGTGSCIVAVRHTARLHVDLIGGEHLSWCKDDLSDLVDLCAHYVENDDARTTMEDNAARFFDQNLYYRSLAAHYLATAMKMLDLGVE
jgi:hypothetical protein